MDEPLRLEWAYGVAAIAHGMVDLSDGQQGRICFASDNKLVVQV
jgi:hypothetical protein